MRRKGAVLRAADEEIEKTISYAIDHGINFFDMVCGRTGVYEAFARVTKGKIKHFGFSFHGSPELLDKVLAEHPEVEFVQIQLNYADWENPIVRSGELYQVLRKYDMPILVMEPVKGGMLANVSPEVASMFESARPGASAASFEGVVTVLSGMSTEEQMQDNLHTFSNFEPLTDAENQILKQAVKAMEKSPTVPCTACRYCVDGCPQNIKIPDIFKSLNTLRMYGEDMRPHFFYHTLTETTGKAKDCIQ